jgi:hypothetical protein
MEDNLRNTNEEETPLPDIAGSRLEDRNPGLNDPPSNLPVTINENTNLPIVDSKFFSSLRLLQSLQKTILYERITLEQQDKQYLQLGWLNMVRAAGDSDKAEIRIPTQQEWRQVELGIMNLIKYLSPRQIWQVQLDQITGFLTLLPFYLMVAAVLCLGGSIWSAAANNSQAFVTSYIMWLMTTGALGSAAFVYVNALSIQVDPTVNVISIALIRMRLLLGALFALMLALPFGLASFHSLSKSLTSLDSNIDIKEGSLLLLPFLLGFSTPLVLSILNRLVVSVQAFFGVQERSDTGRPASQVTTTDNPNRGRSEGGAAVLPPTREATG